MVRLTDERILLIAVAINDITFTSHLVVAEYELPQSYQALYAYGNYLPYKLKIKQKILTAWTILFISMYMQPHLHQHIQ